MRTKQRTTSRQVGSRRSRARDQRYSSARQVRPVWSASAAGPTDGSRSVLTSSTSSRVGPTSWTQPSVMGEIQPGCNSWYEPIPRIGGYAATRRRRTVHRQPWPSPGRHPATSRYRGDRTDPRFPRHRPHHRPTGRLRAPTGRAHPRCSLSPPHVRRVVCQRTASGTDGSLTRNRPPRGGRRRRAAHSAGEGACRPRADLRQ